MTTDGELMTGDQLRHLREQAQLSRQQLADRMGSTHGRVWGTETRGPRTPDEQRAYVDGVTRGGGASVGRDGRLEPPGHVADLGRGDLVKYREPDGTTTTLAVGRLLHDHLECFEYLGSAGGYRDTGKFRALHLDRVLDMRGRPLAHGDRTVAG